MTNHSFSHCHALATGTCLKKNYIIQNVLGIGGFGITYSGIRKDTGNLVAIKEYFPSSLAVRTEQEGLFSLHPFPEKNTEVFNKGRQRFLNEAQILKKLQYLKSIVSVYDLFEENGTAYIVMEYIEGLTLNQYVNENGTFTFPEILNLMVPVIQDLAEIHNKDLIHRDISPDNLILSTDNQLHLIDFGAASKDNPEKNQNTVILKAGYAPPEQYIANGKIGAWTDVYSLCATIYFALTGTAPTEAIQRLEQNSLEPLSNINDLLPWQSAALEKGLSVRPADRFRNMHELYISLMEAPHNERTIAGSNLSRKNKYKIKKYRYRGTSNYFATIISLVCLTILLVFYLPSIVSQHNATKNSSSPATTSSLSNSTTESPMPSAIFTPKKSSDTKLLTMPDVTNITLKKARNKLKKLDSSIKIKVVRKYNTRKATGQIISQSVKKGTTFSKGQLSSIRLTISKGKQPVKTTAPAKTVTPTKKPKQSSDYNVKANDDYVSIPLE